MWRVGSLTMMRRYGISCRSKDANVLILSALVELPYSWISKITEYTAKEFFYCCLLHVSANIEADFGGRRGGGGFARSSLIYPWVE